MKTAVLVIDMQQALCRGNWAAFEIDRVIAHINQVTERARQVGAPVLLIQHEDEGPLQFGSDGWQLDARLMVAPADIRIRKTATDSFHRTGLQTRLQALGVERLVVCGLQSEFCIDSTVRGALAFGYPVTLVADAHSTTDNGVLTAAQITAHHNATLKNLESFGSKATPVLAAELRWDADCTV
jgi:nicotinamidase-related amidase